MGKTLEFLFQLDVAMSNGFSQPARILQGDFAKLQAAGERLQGSMGKIESYQRQAASLQQSAQKCDELRQKTLAASNAAGASRAHTASLGQQYEAAKNRLASWSGLLPKNSLLLTTAQRRVQELGRAYEASQKQTQQLEAQHHKLTRAWQDSEQKASAQRTRLAEMSEGLRKAGVNTEQLTAEQQRLTGAMQRVSQASQKLSAIRETLSWGNLKASFMTAAAFVQPLKAPVKIAADFEEAMQRVKAVAFSTEGADLSGFEMLRKQAIELGATTKFTAIQAAKGQENLLRANLSPQEVIAAMPGLLNMSAAEGMDLDLASSIIAKGLGGMGLEGKYSARLADILAYTSASSNTNIAAIGEAFKVAAPVFAPLGASMEQVASYIGVLANKGYEGSEVGTALASSMMRLADLPSKGSAVLASIGVDPRRFQTKEGRMIELPEIMRMIDAGMKAKKLGDKERLAIISAVFGKNQGKIMSAFLTASASGEAEVMQSGVQNNSFGQARRMADINLDSLNGQITLLGSAWDGFRQRIGDMFSPIVRQGVETLTWALSGLTDIMNKFPKASEGVVTVLTVLAGTRVLSNVLNIGKALVQLPGAWLEMHRAAGMAASVAGTAAVNTGAVAAATTTWGAGLSAIMGWLPLILSLSILIWQNWDKITATMKKVAEDSKALEDRMSYQTTITTPAGEKRELRIPTIKAHAEGGIMTAPHVGLVAEAGPEAIIPLTDKSRGVPLLMRAAELLGLREKSDTFREITQTSGQISSLREVSRTGQDRQSYIVREAGERVSTQSSSIVERTNRSDSSVVSGAPININITATSQNDQDLASRIAEAVRQALSGILEEQERLSYGAV